MLEKNDVSSADDDADDLRAAQINRDLDSQFDEHLARDDANDRDSIPLKLGESKARPPVRRRPNVSRRAIEFVDLTAAQISVAVAYLQRHAPGPHEPRVLRRMILLAHTAITDLIAESPNADPAAFRFPYERIGKQMRLRSWRKLRFVNWTETLLYLEALIEARALS